MTATPASSHASPRPARCHAGPDRRGAGPGRLRRPGVVGRLPSRRRRLQERRGDVLHDGAQPGATTATCVHAARTSRACGTSSRRGRPACSSRRAARCACVVNGQFPFVHLRYQPDPDTRPACTTASPTCIRSSRRRSSWLWGTNGFVVLHAVLLAALVVCGVPVPRARARRPRSRSARRRGLFPGHGHARLCRLDDAGAVQPGDGDAGVFLLALQGSRASGVAAWAADGCARTGPMWPRWCCWRWRRSPSRPTPR